MQSALKLVVQRLPHVGDQAMVLFQNDEVFRDLCDEYQMCDETLMRFETRSGSESLRREYVALRLRLEGELLRYFSGHA